MQLQSIHYIRNSCNANKFKLKKKMNQNRRLMVSDLARPQTSRHSHTSYHTSDFPLVRRNVTHRHIYKLNMSEHVVSCDGANVTAVKLLHFAHDLTTTEKKFVVYVQWPVNFFDVFSLSFTTYICIYIYIYACVVLYDPHKTCFHKKKKS